MQRRLFESPPRSDLHVHTHCSPDSSTSPDDVCRAALRRGLDAVAITDHAETWEPGNPDSRIQFHSRCISTPEEYIREVREVKSRYAGRLSVIVGVEIGYQSTREQEIRALLAEHPFEFALGSIHDSPPVNWWSPTSGALLRNRPDLAREALAFYYTELRKAAESELFDSIGHIDVYERYFPRQWPDIFEDQDFAPIVRAAVEAIARHARMEINLSTLHTLRGFPWSALRLLRMYHEMGGKPPTIGTDSHLPKYVGRDLDKGERLARQAGFEKVADWREVVRNR